MHRTLAITEGLPLVPALRNYLSIASLENLVAFWRVMTYNSVSNVVTQPLMPFSRLNRRWNITWDISPMCCYIPRLLQGIWQSVSLWNILKIHISKCPSLFPKSSHVLVLKFIFMLSVEWSKEYLLSCCNWYKTGWCHQSYNFYYLSGWSDSQTTS